MRAKLSTTEQAEYLAWAKTYGRGSSPSLNLLRWKLYRKAKNERKFRFYTLYDRIWRRDTLWTAWGLVAKEGKAAGVDGVTAAAVTAQENGVDEFLTELQDQLRAKSYRPLPIRRVYIPKGKDRYRPLGIPTLRDRVVQMATVLILEPIFEADFLDCSKGFRPGRGAHDATEQIAKNLKAGFCEVYDADLESYFDSIPHDKLYAAIRMRVVDGSVLKLIRMWLNAPIVEEAPKTGEKRPPRKPPSGSEGKGTPQGGVISPLLANIYLHWFDKFFHSRDGPRQWANARLVRYADDFVVMARYQGARLSDWIGDTLEGRMGLKINQDKTRVVNLRNSGDALDFLGFRFQKRACQWRRKHWYYHQEPSPKSLQKQRDWTYCQTDSSRCHVVIRDLIEHINTHRLGWGHYFRAGHYRRAFRAQDHFVRLRLIKHLKRRSQRAYKKPIGVSWYAHLRNLGLVNLLSLRNEPEPR